MPKQFYKLNDFSGGLNWVRDARDIADNELILADYCYIDRIGSIRSSGAFSPGGQAIPPEATYTAGGNCFVYETDHAPGSAAKTTGAEWISALDSIDGTFDTTTIVSGTYAHSTDVVDLGAADNTTWSASQLIFQNYGANIYKNAGTTFEAANIQAGDFVQITGCSTDDVRNCYAYVSSVGPDYLYFNTNGISNTSSGAEGGSPKITRLIRGVFFAVNDDIRIADGSFSDATQRKKYQYVKRTHFDGAGGAEDTYDNWYGNDCTLTPPTELAITANYPAAGVGFRLTQATPTGGSFGAKTWQIAGSLIYEDDQESLLYIPTSNHEITTAADDSIDLDIRATPPFDERVTGARIYIRESGSRNAWSMLVDISLREGVRSKFDSEYTAWTRGSSDTEVYVNTTLILAENFETYSIINGFAPDEFKITLSATGETYVDAIIANRRCFVANVRMLDPEGNGTSDLMRMRDRLMYTPPGKFDTFPRSFFIDVIRGDADEYTALAYYADRLLAFKKQTLYIINVASPSPSNWFLESTEVSKGVNYPGAVWTDTKGIFWANHIGVFYYNGSQIVDLTEGKLAKDSRLGGPYVGDNVAHWTGWASYLPMVYFLPTANMLFVKNNAYSLDDREGNLTLDNRGTWVYSFYTNAWTRLRYDGYGTEPNYWYGNVVKTKNNNLYSGRFSQNLQNGNVDTTPTQGSFQTELIESSNHATNTQVVLTKDIDFGNPAKVKKVYSVILTYRSRDAMTTPVSYAIDGEQGDGDYTNFTGDFADTGHGDNLDNWATVKVTPASPISCQSIKIKIKNTAGSSSRFELNDISIEYRETHKRVS